MNATKNTSFGTLALFIFAANVWATNGLFPTFAGAKAAGRGGVDLAIAADSSAINTNPAGIAFIPGKMVDLNLGAFYPSIQLNNASNRAESDTEFSPYGSFSLVWDSPGQTLEVFTEPFSYTFGGEVSSSYEKSAGEAFFSWGIAVIPHELRLTAEGVGSVGDIRVYAEVPSSDVLWQSGQVPEVPAGASVTAVRVHFEWLAAGPGEIFLEAEQSRKRLAVAGPAGEWREGYLALPWEKSFVPAYVALKTSRPGDLQIRNARVAIQYRFGSESVWQEVAGIPGQPDMVLLSRDTQTYPVLEGNPVEITVKDFSAAPRAQKIHLYYHYDLGNPGGVFVPAFLNTTVKSGEEVVGSRCHLPPPREISPRHEIVSRNRADYALPHPEHSAGFKFGLGIFPQTGAKFTLKTKTILFPEGIENRTDQAFLSLAPALAYRFDDYFSIGVAFNANLYSFELDGLTAQKSLILRGTPPGLPPGSLTFGEAVQSALNTAYIRGEGDTDRMFGYGFGGRVGMMWKMSDRIQFGAMYSPRTWMQRTKGKAKVDFSRHFASNPIFQLLAGLTLPNEGRFGFSSNYDLEMEFDLPQRAGIGLSCLMWDNFLVSADFQWIDYSDTMDKIRLIFHHGNNPDMDALATPRVHGVVESGWKDQYVVAIGVVWQPADAWTLRMGYNYGNNPIPRKNLDPQFPGIIEHHVMLGIGYRTSPYFEITTGVEWGLPARMKSGAENLVHPDLTYSELRIYTLAALLNVNWNF